jgi:tRNA-Thr(GGU) m(6)t(6)A37 methyltransferase TsaA
MGKQMQEHDMKQSRMFYVPLMCATIGVCGFYAEQSRADQAGETSFTVRPIGYVRIADGRTRIVLDKKYEAGLLGLHDFSHMYVFWWFNKNDTPERRATLQVHPRGNKENPLTGVFATRSPARPNLIAMTLCKIVSVKDNVVEVEKIDAFSDTPVLDMKPFLPGYDSATDVKLPDWARPKQHAKVAPDKTSS